MPRSFGRGVPHRPSNPDPVLTKIVRLATLFKVAEHSLVRIHTSNVSRYY